MNTMKELEAAMINLNLELIEDYHRGNINDNRLKMLDEIIKLYSVVKVREPPEKVNTSKSK